MFSILISVSASFAADENATDLVMDTQKEDIVEFSNQNEIVDASDESAVSADYSDNVNDNSSSIIPGNVVKRYNGAIEYYATFLDNESKPLKNTIVYCGVDSVLCSLQKRVLTHYIL